MTAAAAAAATATAARRSRRPAPARSLKARALQWLAQREQSRAELRRKLLAAARADAAAAAAATAPADTDAAAASVRARDRSDGDAERDPAASAAQVDALLEWLEANGYLSDARFVESRVHARAARFGNVRIRQELKRHATALPTELAAALSATEVDRARSLLERRFASGAGAPAGALTAAARAKRARFLIGRGFSPEVVQRVVREAPRAALDDEAGAVDDD